MTRTLKVVLALVLILSNSLPTAFGDRIVNDTNMQDELSIHSIAESTIQHLATAIAPRETTTSTDATKNAIVYIQTNKLQGSGIVLSADGLIATNYHVLEGASNAQIIFADNEVYKGEVRLVGLDTSKDIALIRIDKSGLTPANVSKKFAVGQTVTAVGAPGGSRNTVSNGTVGGFDQDYIASSAPIYHGSSGGGLFNAKGEVIGMTSAFTSSNYLAIPIASVLDVPQNLNVPIGDISSLRLNSSAPEDVRYTLKGDYAYVTWSPIYPADYYYIYMALSEDGDFQKIKNTALGDDYWYWGFPYGFGISAGSSPSMYLKVTAVIDGVESDASEVLEINW